MSLRIDIIFEDRGHELFFSSFIPRLFRSFNSDVNVTTYSDKRGYPGVKRAIRIYFNEHIRTAGLPDAVAIIYDADTRSPKALRDEVKSLIPAELHAIACICCCKPHVERLLLLDFQAFRVAVGYDGDQPPRGPRGDFKGRLRHLTELAVGVAPLGVLENANEIVAQIDVGRFGQRDRLVQDFVKCLSHRAKVATAARQ